MTLETFNEMRQQRLESEPRYRKLCVQCLQPEFGCYCAHVKKIDPKIKFVILIHPIEVKRRIATGRMSHLCLQNSEMIVGQDYTDNRRVNQIIESPEFETAVLYPGVRSQNLSKLQPEDRALLFSPDNTPVIFVIDGTWATARKTMHLSQNLKLLPRIGFTPPHKSKFQVRKQPGVECFSTIEAIHHLIELLGSRPGYDVSQKEHDHLLFVFRKMVERQLRFVSEVFKHPRQPSYRRPKETNPSSLQSKIPSQNPS